MHNRTEIIISIGSMRLDVARCQRGQIIGRASAWLDRVTLEQAWHTNLHSLDAALAQLLRSVDAPSGAMTIVEYASPASSVDVIAAPEGQNPETSARRLLADSSRLDLQAEPSLILPACTSHEAGSEQSHFIGAADRDAHLDALRNWVRRAGLTPMIYVPLDVAAILTTLKRAEETPSDAPRLIVHLGDRRTIIALRDAGEFKLIRCVDIGATQLVDAAAGASATDAATIDSSQRKSAFELLMRQGITFGAARSTQTDASNRLLPFINPVLQRYFVELRQTLRFGLSTQAAARAELDCFGSGSVFPSFAATIAAALELQVAPGSLGMTDLDSPHTVDLGLSLQFAHERISLFPESHRRSRRERRASRSMLVGAALAAFAVLGDATHVWTRVQDEQARLQRIAPRHDELTQRSDLVFRRDQLRTANAQMYRALRDAVADQPDWRTLFAEIASATHASMKFTDLTVATGSGGPTMVLRGVASLPPGWDTNDDPSAHVLSPFIQTIAAASSIESVDLGETRTAELNGVPVEVFAADLKLRGLPYAIPTHAGRNP
jgi:hypothetical protein